MKFKFTIAARLILGFGILTVAMMASSYMIYQTLSHNRQISDRNMKVYAPSVDELNRLYMMINNSEMLIKNWVHVDQKPDTPDKLKLKELHSIEFDKTRKKLDELSKDWGEENREHYKHIITQIEDTLFEQHRYIMESLATFQDYEEVMVLFEIRPKVEQNGEVIITTDSILTELRILLDKLEEQAQEGSTEMVESFDNFQAFIIWQGVVLFFAALIIAFLTIRSIVAPINSLKRVLLSMSKGILPKEKMKTRRDEIGEMTNALNLFIDGLQETIEFSLEIGKGNFDSAFKPLSEHDDLGNSLVDMRRNLQEAAQKDEERKREDEERNWVTRGIAMFGDILRQDNNDLNQLSYNVISNLVKYVEANQGGLFILNDDDPGDVHLEMTAAYAYDRRKFARKTVHKGEGLVWTCYMERATIHMTDIPDSYLNITSGLGKSNPRSLLIVPLRVNEEIYGVLEMASFNSFEKYQIEFVEKVAESIASTIASVKINTRTARLLQESKEQGEQLIQQEEEMRQNLEELQSTQEEAARRSKELENRLKVIQSAIGLFEMDVNGNILDVNEHLLQILGMSHGELIGKNHQMLISTEHINVDKYQVLLNDIKKGIRHSEQHIYDTAKGQLLLNESYVPIKDENNEISSVLVIVVEAAKEIQQTNI